VPTLVVAALSARLLASSARRAGWDVVALDLFGDVDTHAVARAWFPIGDPIALRIERERFLAALETARRDTDCFGWVAGAGFEPQPELLEAGARVLPLLGNPRATVERVRDPRTFFAALAQRAIAHPETRFDPPADPRGWLSKDFAASGGWHIQRADAGAPAPGSSAYFQREAGGRSMSVLFVGTGEQGRTIALNELLVRAHGARPHIYHGAIGPVPDLPPQLVSDLSETVDALVRRFALRGLGSLDFLLDAGRFSVLEINPRPPATMGLYDSATHAGLLKVHADACAGSLPPSSLWRDAPRARGEAIVFATSAVRVTPQHVQGLLALGCRDVPQPGSRIPAGAPLCSVVASGADLDAVRIELGRHETMALAMVQNRNEEPPDAS
jgi:predicted ATP-grasp superfamily ATP-dependent carboligase